MEKNTQKLIIAGESYMVTSEETPEYMNKLASELDSKMTSILKTGRLSTTQAAVLVALEYADTAKKNSTTTDNLRAQIKDYLQDAAKAKSERDFFEHELERMKAARKAEGAPSDPALW